MSQLKITVVDQTLTITNAPVIASGGANEDQVVFTFADDTWSGFMLTCIFFNDDTKSGGNIVAVSNNMATIPHEQLLNPGTLNIGLIASNGVETVRTSELVKVRIVPGGDTTEIVEAPTVDIYTQLLDAVAESVIPTQLHELNNNASLAFWVGTAAEYAAITPQSNVIYIITDDSLDFVVKEEIIDGWRVRRWSNGTIEAFYVQTYEEDELNFTRWSDTVFISGILRIPIPSGIFRPFSASLNDLHGDVTLNHLYYWMGGTSINKTNVQTQVFSPHSGTNPQQFSLKIHITQLAS